MVWSVTVEPAAGSQDLATYALTATTPATHCRSIKDAQTLRHFHARACAIGLIDAAPFPDLVLGAPGSEAAAKGLERYLQAVCDRAASIEGADRLVEDFLMCDARAVKAARRQAAAEAREALARKTRDILGAVQRATDAHRRDLNATDAAAAASVAAAATESLATQERFEKLHALAVGAIETARRSADDRVAQLERDNAALRADLNRAIAGGVSNLSGSPCADPNDPAGRPVTSSDSSGGSDRGSSERGGSDRGGGSGDDTAKAKAPKPADLRRDVVTAVVAALGANSAREDAAARRERALVSDVAALRAALARAGVPSPVLACASLPGADAGFREAEDARAGSDSSSGSNRAFIPRHMATFSSDDSREAIQIVA